MDIAFRGASEEDAKRLLEIYAPYVRDTAITMECHEPSVEEFGGRIRTISQSYPYLVAVDEKGTIVGYAYAHAFNEREAYRYSAEMSIYLDGGVHGKGLGSRLYGEMEMRLRKMGIKVLYAKISTTPRSEDPYLTDASVRFHGKMGYHLCGTFTNCCYKFGLWYNIICMEKSLV